MTARPVLSVTTAHHQLEGGGFLVRRPFPTRGLPHVDPFLLLDEMGPADYGPGEAVGAPDHPHRGFETVTYVLEGAVEHEDSAGHQGRIGPGDVQWMTAGAGVVHSEMPSEQLRREGGRMHGFQLWVNLPAAVAGRAVVGGQLARLGPGDALDLGVRAEAEDAAELLLLAGVPIREPVVQWGPFVMNRPEQIQQAIRDYQSGAMGRIAR